MIGSPRSPSRAAPAPCDPSPSVLRTSTPGSSARGHTLARSAGEVLSGRPARCCSTAVRARADTAARHAQPRLRCAGQAGAAAPTSPISPTSTRTRPRAARSRWPRSAPSTASTRSSCAARPTATSVVALGDPAGRRRLRLLGRPCLGIAADLLGRRGRRRLRPPRRRPSRLPADRMWVAFELRPEAKFSDGTPVTAEDVAWTYRTLLTQGRPSFRIQMADVKDVVVEGPRRVVFHFKTNTNRAIAAGARRPAGAAGALVQGPRLHPPADRMRRSAPARTASPISSSAAASPSSAIPNWWAAKHADRHRHQQFRPGADRVFPRLDRGDGGVQGRLDRPAVARTSRRTGPPPTTFPR